MAIRNISQIYDNLAFIIRKSRGVFITIPQAMSALDSGQMDAFSDWFKLYAVNQEVHDALRSFKTYQPFTSASDGSVSYPQDYQHLLAGVFTVMGSTVNQVRFVNTDEWPRAITSQLRPVSTSKPIAQDIQNGFQLYPQSQQTGAYWYLRRPATPVYAYTQTGRTITYNPLASTQIEFLDVYVDNIIAKALKYFGINMSDQEVSQFAAQLDKETE